MSRGIDPTTHRPINEAVVVPDSKDHVTKNISFSNTSTSSKEEEHNMNPVGIVVKEESSPVRERCPD